MSETLTLPRIKKLTSSLANQIAAGEVIERPASVIKELLENSLDAGATRIMVEVSRAGTQMIKVSDNGFGIHPDDLQLALERHATAKLTEQSDLAAISSLGFRGEALPSISSVAVLSLTSRIAEREQAACLLYDPLSAESIFRPAAHPVGTTVEVKNLFHNTPARKKFLSSERTEFLHIHEMVRRLALSRADVSIELRHNNQKVLSCRAMPDDLQTRAGSLIGASFINNATAIDHAVGAMRIYGWLGTGDLGRSSTDRQYLYLNGRMIRDKRLNHAIRLACEGSIAEGRFPSYLLYLNLDLNEADVNVHPTKHEVRFRHARDVHDFIFSALSTSLAKSQDLYASALTETGKRESPYSGVHDSSDFLRRHNLSGDRNPGYVESQINRQKDLIEETPSLGKPLLQIQQNYIITQRAEMSLLINIAEAKKYIAREKLAQVSQVSPISSRPLLVPVRFQITEKQENTLEHLAPLLQEYALQLESAGPGTCILRTIPSLLVDADLESLVNDILNLHLTDSNTEKSRVTLCITMIKHVCDISTADMSVVEMLGILRQLESSGVDVNLPRCPPIWISLSSAHFDRLMRADD